MAQGNPRTLGLPGARTCLPYEKKEEKFFIFENHKVEITCQVAFGGVLGNSLDLQQKHVSS